MDTKTESEYAEVEELSSNHRALYDVKTATYNALAPKANHPTRHVVSLTKAG
jgi:hypothetical protein